MKARQDRYFSNHATAAAAARRGRRLMTITFAYFSPAAAAANQRPRIGGRGRAAAPRCHSEMANLSTLFRYTGFRLAVRERPARSGPKGACWKEGVESFLPVCVVRGLWLRLGRGRRWKGQQRPEMGNLSTLFRYRGFRLAVRERPARSGPKGACWKEGVEGFLPVCVARGLGPRVGRGGRWKGQQRPGRCDTKGGSARGRRP